MTEPQAPYETKPAGLFHAMITECIIWAWCPVCGVRTDQAFRYEDDRCEYYECKNCHRLHGIAVR